MIRLTAATAATIVLAQLTGDGGSDGIVSALTQFGVAAPFALLALYGLKEYRAENKRLLELVLEAIPVLAESNKLASETTKTLGEVSEMLRTQMVTASDIQAVRRIAADYIRRNPGT